jgi:hypothetical protein
MVGAAGGGGPLEGVCVVSVPPPPPQAVIAVTASTHAIRAPSVLPVRREPFFIGTPCPKFASRRDESPAPIPPTREGKITKWRCTRAAQRHRRAVRGNQRRSSIGLGSTGIPCPGLPRALPQRDHRRDSEVLTTSVRAERLSRRQPRYLKRSRLRPEALRPRLAAGLPSSNLDPKLNRIAVAKRSDTYKKGFPSVLQRVVARRHRGFFLSPRDDASTNSRC